MGIPGFYRWLVDSCPDTICCVAEDFRPPIEKARLFTTKPNPNGVEFDNLYIDINGVIHPCFHPEEGPVPQSYDEVFNSIYRYIDRIFSIVRPRKLLFLAVDGVAPRAKMNHQRIRRFRAAKEAAGRISKEKGEGIGKSESDKKLDSNVITPGTEFMDLLSSALKYYVHVRMNLDIAWKNIKVILSDSSVVGEGEHKIMSYIRSQRNLPGYNPNTRHCLHGLDADLILLALATHEIHFSILRELTRTRHFRNGRVVKYCGGGKFSNKPCYSVFMRQFLRDLKFEFFNIWVLREYLEQQLLPSIKGANFERLVDDFVFICVFVGNDFLPKLPSLDISEGGINLLLIVYQEEFVKMGYLTCSSKVNLKSMEHFLQALSSHEKAIFMKRRQVLLEKKRKRRCSQGSLPCSLPCVEVDNKYSKPTYYTEKFDCTSDDVDRIRRDAVLKYTEGVCWVMNYYYQGVCSWQWFYPYHYAPFASDFCDLDKLEIHFTLGQPFKPLDQLLAVLPAASAQALPLFYRELMTQESSPILDFYPKDAKVDMNGKKRAWQGVCKLPFIDEPRLISEIVKVEHTLTDEEKQRNRLGRDTLFVHCEHPLATKIENHPLMDPSLELQIKIKPKLSGGMNGYVCISDEPVLPHIIPSPVDGMGTFKQNRVKSVGYKYPSFHAHVCKLPSGVIMPPRILGSQDIPSPPVPWHATPVPSQSVLSESPIKKRKTRKHKQEGQKSCTNENLAPATEPKMQAFAVELGMAPVQHGNDNGVDRNLIDNGVGEGKLSISEKLESELHLVEGREMICGANQSHGKLINKIEPDLLSGEPQEIIVGYDEPPRHKQVKGGSTLDNGTKMYKGGIHERAVDEIEGKEKIADVSEVLVCEKPTKRTDSGFPSSRELEIVGRENEPKRKQKKKSEKREKLDLVVDGVSHNSITIDLIEGTENIVGRKPMRNQQMLSDNCQQVIGGESEDCKSVELGRKRHSKRRRLKGEVDLVEKKDQIDGAGQTLFSKEQEIIGGDVNLVDEVQGGSQKMNVDVGEEPTNKINCDFVVSDKGQEVKSGENGGEHKRKKRRKRKQVGTEPDLVEEKIELSGEVENGNDLEVGERPRKGESDLQFANEQEIVDGGSESRSKEQEATVCQRHVRLAEEKGKVNGGSESRSKKSDLPFSKEQETMSMNEPKMKKRKRKQPKGDIELHLVEGKVEMPTEETVGGENELRKRQKYES